MKKHFITMLVLIISIFFILIGVYKKQEIDVYNKARMICFECIGIG